MKTGFGRLAGRLGILAAAVPLAFPQQQNGPAPIYRVTVVERTVKAVNYQYRSDPTRIDFRGTVLLPQAKGEAMVQSRQGRTEIDAKFEGLKEPQGFSREYLTYVLWAITPEGRPHNIGELLPGASDKANIRVTTDLQAFALIVTAEPHSAVRQPSDVVVMENEIRPDTVGTIKPVEAKYELLPRGEYTWNVTPAPGADQANGPKVSTHEYEATVELYQAQNAIGIAVQAGADRYAPDTLGRAQQLLTTAQQLHNRKADFRQVVQSAREASQTAEDARVIAKGREVSEKLQAANVEQAKLQAQLADALQQKQQALADAQAARSQADAARAQADAAQMQAESALAARRHAELESDAARVRPPEPPPAVLAPNGSAALNRQTTEAGDKRTLRAQLFEELNRTSPTLDTGRGLVVTVSDSDFRYAALRDQASERISRIASLLSAHPDLRISVEGYSDDSAKEPLSRDRADTVRQVLVARGLSARAVLAVGLGDARPLGSNATAQGRTANSRVEIVIAGEPIGDLPLWERPSALTGARPSTAQ